jgi:hypothetical protein
MSQEQQNFESLQRLMALKRHEVPPPGYFHHFSDEVVNRLRSGERGEEAFLQDLFSHAPWLQRLWTTFETKPIYAGAFGAALCALLVWGVFYSVTMTPTLVNLQSVVAVDPPPATTGKLPENTAVAAFPGSEGGVAMPGAVSLFGTLSTPQPQTVVFRPNANN